jgi:hypothetical protein
MPGGAIAALYCCTILLDEANDPSVVRVLQPQDSETPFGVAFGVCLAAEEAHSAGHGSARPAYQRRLSWKPTPG